MAQSVGKKYVDAVADNFEIMYTPFHGCGYKLVPEALRRLGMKHVTFVTEQMVIDGNFPTVKSPNPENVEGFELAIKQAKEKGIDLYLAAAKAIKNKYKNAVFHICGYCDDERYTDILKQAEADGYIKYHGEQKDMIPFFEMANCLVHPSYYPEGMSNVLLEAAAHARPIIATDRSGCRETVDDGETGFVIPIKDEGALISAIDRFMQMSEAEKQAMGLAGRKKMEREFDRALVVKAYMDEIDKICESV